MLLEYSPDAVLRDLFRLQFSKFLNAAALAAFAFDYCLTFSTEVEYVWGTRWEPARIVFTVSRYLPFISSPMTFYDVPLGRKCGSFIVALDVMYMASVIFAEEVLILRTYALWGRSKKVLIFLSLLAGAFLAVALVLSMLVEISLPGDATSFYSLYPSACGGKTLRTATPQYAFLMAYEIILQGMNSWRKFWTYRNVHSKLLNTLYWDGILYMWWIIALSTANMTVDVAAPIGYIPALHTAQVAMHSVLASRIFFNLKQCDEQIIEDGYSLETFHCRARSTASVTS